MLNIAHRIKSHTQLKWRGIFNFNPKIKMQLDLGPYTIKTAETPEELIECFKLRHEVFNVEFRGLRGAGLDFDQFDYHYDHLVILHKKSNQIIGTYRLSFSNTIAMSYTALEFDLRSIKKSQIPCLELGRACIHREYRKGTVIALLWRGIAEYMKKSGALILYGCSSLKINNVREAALIYRYLVESGHLSSEFNSLPTKEFKMAQFDAWYCHFSRGLDESQKIEAEALIPSLLKSYLKMGAKILCEPAFDKDFDCIDLLTLLKRDELNASMSAKFQISN